MPRMRRSFLLKASTVSGTSSVISNDSSRKSIVSYNCNLCSKLLPANCRSFQKFSSIESKTDHAKIHSDQTEKIINNNISEINAIDDSPEKFPKKCFSLSINNPNTNNGQISETSNNNKIGSNRNFSSENEVLIPKISLKLSDCIDESEGLEQIRAIITKNGSMFCKMCPRERRSRILIIDQDCDRLKLESIVLNSTKHLSGLSLYTCNICEYSTNLLTDNGMYEHYSTEHLDIEPQLVKSHYFTANYLKNQLTILKTIKQCFGFELINCESELLELEKIHESATELRLILLRKQLINKNSIECRKCAKLINFKSSHDWDRVMLLEHAKGHLTNIPILCCVICNESTVTCSGMKRHLEKEHSIFKRPRIYYIDNSVNFDKEMDLILHECFQRTADQGLDMDRRPRPDRINRYWVDLRKKIGSNKRIRCRICLASIATNVIGKVFSITCVLMHALLHIDPNLPIYECTLCNRFSTASLWSMRQHFKKCHQDIKLSDLRRYYKNNKNKFEPEIACVLKKCFDDPITDAANELYKCVNNGTSANRSLIKTKQKGDIGSACDELIKFSLNEFNRLECQLCTKEIIAISNKQILRFSVLEHAMLHTKLLLYSCNVCSFDSSTRTRMQKHASNNHPSNTKGGNYFRNNCEKFKKEIIEALKKCFHKN